MEDKANTKTGRRWWQPQEQLQHQPEMEERLDAPSVHLIVAREDWEHARKKVNVTAASIITWLLLGGMIGLLLLSCQKDSDDNNPDIPEEPEVETPYPQYGTPFEQVPGASDVVMYEVNIRAFGPGSDLQAVTDRLDAIEALGTNVIWLMPIHPIGEINSVNSPYSVKDYKAVNPEFGTLDDLRELTDGAHSRGMAVIMDWVANHTAWDNPWIESTDWYTQDANGNIIHPPGTNWQDVADLNYGDTAMRSAMIDAMVYWTYVANVDGFRCDYADGVPFSFWKEALAAIEEAPGREFIFLAEGTRSDHFTAGFDLNFGWQFYGAVKDVFNGQGAGKLFTADNNEYGGTPSGRHWLRFTTNHDESAWDATPVALFNGIDGTMAASVVTIFTGGVPLIYGSQEVGRAANVPFFSTSTINWNANPGMREAYEKILQFYTGSEVAREGQNTVYPHDDVVCLKKTLEGEEILILANVRDTTVNFDVPPQLQNTSWTDIRSGESIQLESEFSLTPYQYHILQP